MLFLFSNSTSIDFDRFELSEDAQMYICNGDGTMVTGPIGYCYFRVQASSNPVKGILYVTVEQENDPGLKPSLLKTRFILRDLVTGRIVKQWTAAGNLRQYQLSLPPKKELTNNPGKL